MFHYKFHLIPKIQIETVRGNVNSHSPNAKIVNNNKIIVNCSLKVYLTNSLMDFIELSIVEVSIIY